MTDQQRRVYEMTDVQYAQIAEECQAGATDDQMKAAWQKLAGELGCDWTTIMPTPESDRIFTAVPVVGPDSQVQL